MTIQPENWRAAALILAGATIATSSALIAISLQRAGMSFPLSGDVPYRVLEVGQGACLRGPFTIFRPDGRPVVVVASDTAYPVGCEIQR